LFFGRRATETGARRHHRPVNRNPTPALVTQRAAQRLPRAALLLFCAAYVLPGVFGRDPWRVADITAFGYMAAMAEGRTSWLAPTVGQLPLEQALLPHWLGAASIVLLSPLLGAELAARVPFALLLALTLALVWYATFHLARTEAAQPVAFAFGGEADTVAYARAMADGAVLALIATLGLLQLGHETTPALAQLAGVALFQWAMASAPFRRQRARAAALVALPLVAASGAPGLALLLGAIGVVLSRLSAYEQVRRLVPWVLAATVAAVATATLAKTWQFGWRLRAEPDQWLGIVRLWLWFLWPASLLALWTVWRWRHHLFNRHIAVPLTVTAAALAVSTGLGGADEVLMLGLPGLAVLAAFALPTLQRGAAAAIDWFSVFFFSACAIAVWGIYTSLQLGVPGAPARNVARLASGYEPSFSAVALAVALAGTAAWVWLVRWRTARHRAALWKSLVLPAGGVALTWLLVMTLLLPVLDYVRSDREWVARIAPHVPPGSCIAAPDVGRAAIAALEYHGRWRVDGRPDAAAASGCDVLLRRERQRTHVRPGAGWTEVARVQRPDERRDATRIYRRDTAPAGGG
jgi:4-amino-4-deoxy-L-arabinose transferase-like glycosyltransferase